VDMIEVASAVQWERLAIVALIRIWRRSSAGVCPLRRVGLMLGWTVDSRKDVSLALAFHFGSYSYGFFWETIAAKDKEMEMEMEMRWRWRRNLVDQGGVCGGCGGCGGGGGTVVVVVVMKNKVVAGQIRT